MQFCGGHATCNFCSGHTACGVIVVMLVWCCDGYAGTVLQWLC